MTSGKWLSILLRPFHGPPVAQFHCHTWTSECRVQTGRVPSMQAVCSEHHSTDSAAGSWVGGLAASSPKSRSVALQGAAGAGAGVHVHVRLTLTLRPQHAPSHTWHRASVRQLCNCNCTCTSPAPGRLHSHSLLPATSKTRSVRSACTAHKHTSVHSARLPTTHRSHSIIISVSLDLPRSRSFLSHPTSATLDDNNSNITSGSRQTDSTHPQLCNPQSSAFPHYHALFCPRASIPIETHLIRLAALLIDIDPRV